MIEHSDIRLLNVIIYNVTDERAFTIIYGAENDSVRVEKCSNQSFIECYPSDTIQKMLDKVHFFGFDAKLGGNHRDHF